MVAIIISALSLGLISSLHCLGMCGPIALVLPVNRKTTATKILGITLYNVGRIVTYGFLGTLIGFFGEGLRLIGISQIASIVLGVLLLISVLWMKKKLPFSLDKPFSSLRKLIQTNLGKHLNSESHLSLFIIGILNGLLPCGVVFIAMQGALIQQQLLHSIWFMILFGVGTIPMLFSISYLMNHFSPSMKLGINRAIPYLSMVVALLLIMRGLNLNIPYLSPSYNVQNNEVTCCHKPK